MNRRSLLCTFLLLVAFTFATAPQTLAQSTKTESSDVGGPGGTHEINTNADGTLFFERYFDAKGNVRMVVSVTYHPGTKKVMTEEMHQLSPTGSVTSTTTIGYDLKGELTSLEGLGYGLNGVKTSGYRSDHVNNRFYIYDPKTETWSLEPPKPQAPKQEPAPPPQKISNTLAPSDLGFVFPANINPGETFSGSIMPANVAMNYDGVPGLVVKTFKVPMPTGPGLPGGINYRGLELGSSETGFSPADDGMVTIRTLQKHKTLSFVARQIRDLRSPIGLEYAYKKPLFSDSEFIMPHPPTAEEIQDTKDELDWAWDDYLEWKDDIAKANARGASEEELDYLYYKKDKADDYVDDVANYLPAKTVHDLALFKAGRAQLLLEGGLFLTSYGHDSLVREVDFFRDEAAYEWMNYSGHYLTVYTTQPIAQVGRLDVIRGPFTGDCHHTRITIDHWPVNFIGQDINETYFMLPDWITPGKHTLDLQEGPFEYQWPIFVMELKMSIDIPELHLYTYPQSTKWHLTLAGLNGFPASNWSGGGFSPDLVSLVDIPKLPAGFQPPNSTRQGQIVLTVTNNSTNVIDIPEITGGKQTWILDAQKFAPAGEFHLDADAVAKMHGNYTITGLAVAMLKPLEATPVPSMWNEGFSGNQLHQNKTEVSDKTPQELADEAKKKYVQALDDRYQMESKMGGIWHDIILSVSKELSLEHGIAAHNFWNATDAWEKAKAVFAKDPSDANNKALSAADQKRFDTKEGYERAREKVLDSVDKKLADSWREAHGDHEYLLWREGMAKEGWEDAQKEANAAKTKE